MAVPKRFQKFQEDFPKVAEAYESLGDAVIPAITAIDLPSTMAAISWLEDILNKD